MERLGAGAWVVEILGAGRGLSRIAPIGLIPLPPVLLLQGCLGLLSMRVVLGQVVIVGGSRLYSLLRGLGDSI